MSNSAALEALEQRLASLERKANALIEVINDLRAEDGLPPRPPFGGGSSDTASAPLASGQITTIQPDTFYGKKMQTAVREYLEMRRASGLGPAKPREILEALQQGGFQSEAKSDHVALVGIRAMLRKRTNYFHRLPNGTYGLTAWYPNAKAQKPSAEPQNGDTDEDEEPNGDNNGSESDAADTKSASAA